MDGHFNLEKWLRDAIKNVKKDGITKDLHLDEISSVFSINKINRIALTFEFFNNFSNMLKSFDTDDIGIILSIELHKKSKNISKGFLSIEEIERNFEQYSVPEIIVYKPFKPERISSIEFYRVPLFHLDYKLNKDVYVFLKQYRDKDEINTNSKFNRELNLVYQPIDK